MENVLARRARQYALEMDCTLTKAATKVASEYGLNKPEVEQLCGELNHMVAAEQYVRNPLGTFKIARAEDVTGREAVKNMVYIGSSANTGHRKVASAEYEFEYTRPVINQMIKESTEIINRIYDLQEQSNSKYLQIKGTVKALLEAGESPDDIYEVLAKTWGDNARSKRVFDDIISDMKKAGVVEDGVDYKLPAMSDRELAETPLKKQASELLDINDSLLTNECGYYYNDYELTKIGENTAGLDQIFTGKLLKEAAIPPNAGAMYADSLQNLLNPGVADSLYTLSRPASSLFGSTLKKALPVALIGLGMAAVNKVRDVSRSKAIKSGLKDNLRNDPDLADKSPEEFNMWFNKAFDTYTHINPGIVNGGEHELGEDIKKAIIYNSLDSSALDRHRRADAQRDSKNKQIYDLLKIVGTSKA